MKHRPEFWLIVRRIAIALVDASDLGSWHCDALRTWTEAGRADRGFAVKRAEALALELERLRSAHG